MDWIWSLHYLMAGTAPANWNRRKSALQAGLRR